MFLRLTLLSALTLSGLVPASTANSDTTQTAATPPDPGISVQRMPMSTRPDKKPPVEYDPHTVVVKFRGAAPAAAQALRSRGAKKLGTVANTGYVEVRSAAPAKELLASLRKDKAVEDVTLNYLARKMATPNDPAYAEGVQRYLGTVRLPYTWNSVRSATRQVIAVVDTGIDASHPDLRGRVVAGYNVVAPGRPPTDTDGHGTMVAGTAAANTNNRIGVAGVVWDGRVMPIKVFIGETAKDTDIARGIIFAYTHGARIINLSLGSLGPTPYTLGAIKEANKRGVLVVAASGNYGDDSPIYPAAYPEVLAVGATDQQGALTDFSSWGHWVDLTAPGWDIVTTGPGNTYFYGSGTSFSAPIVAGVAALLRARYPSMTPGQVMGRLKATARDAGPRGIDPFYGHGFLDTYHLIGGPWAPELQLNSLGETNDVPDRATPIPSSNSAQGTFLMEGDIDWYRFDAARPVTIRVWPPAFVESRPQNVDPAIVVYDADLKFRGFANTPGPAGGLGKPEAFSINITTGPTYIAVYNVVGARDGRPYTLTVNPGPAQTRNPGTQLWIRNATPADFSTSVRLDAKPTVTFGRTVDPDSVNPSTVRLVHGRTGAAVPSTVTLIANTATIAPTAPLQDNTPYRISVLSVRDTAGQQHTGEAWGTFRTVNMSPGPVTSFDAFGWTPGAVRLAWQLPNISDLDQVVVRRAAGTTPPSSPTAGTPVTVTSSTGTIASGLANNTTYSFSAWVRDRTGLYSSNGATTLMVGSRVGSAAAPTTVTNGQTVKLSALLQRVDSGFAVAGHPIYLHARQHGTSAWRLVGKFTTSATGWASFSYKPSVGRDYVWSYFGSVDLVGSQSGVRAVHVRPVISSNVTKSSIPLGSSLLFYGSVSPSEPGGLVFLQRLVGTRWTHVAATRLTSRSTYMFGIKPVARGSYVYRAVKPADSDHLLAISPNRGFRVT